MYKTTVGRYDKINEFIDRYTPVSLVNEKNDNKSGDGKFEFCKDFVRKVTY